jgi:hypothetical protein
MNVTQAKQQLAEAQAAVALAVAVLDLAREDASEDPRLLSRVVKAERDVSRAESRRDIANSGLRLAEERRRDEEARIAAENERVREEFRQLARRRLVDCKGRFRDWLTSVQAKAQGFEREFAQIGEQLPMVEGWRPQKWSAWAGLHLAIEDQLYRLPAPKSATPAPRPATPAPSTEED